MKDARSSRSANSSGSQLILGLAIAASVSAIVFAFIYPGTPNEVANGSALFSNLLWLLACTLSLVWAGLSGLAPRKLGQIPLRWRFGLMCWLVVLLAVCVSTVVMGPAANFRFALNAMWQWVTSGAIVLTVCLLLAGCGARANRLANMLFLVTMVCVWCLAAFGCYQKIVEIPSDIKRFEADPVAVMRQAGIEVSDGEGAMLLFKGRLYDASPSATFSLTNNLAIVLAVSFVLLSGMTWRSWSVSRERAILFAVVVGVPILMCLVWTKSRTAWLAVMAGLALLVVLNLRQWLLSTKEGRRVGAVTVVGGVMLVALVYLFAASRFNEALISLSYRVTYWVTTMEIVKEHPWLGVAAGNFQDYYSQFKLPEAAETVSDPHSMWFETAAVGGIAAGIALVVACAMWVISSILARNLESFESDPSRQADLPNDRFLGSAVAIGALVGALLPWVVFVWIGILPSAMLYGISVPLIALCAFLAHRGVMNDVAFASGTWAAATVTFLISLSFSGGWMTPGVSNSLFVLLGVMCYADSVSGLKSEDVVSARGSRLWFSIGTVTAAIVCLVFYISTWQRVRAAAEGLREVQDARRVLPVQKLKELVSLDSVDPALWQNAADVEWMRCMSQLVQMPNPVEINSRVFEDFKYFSNGYVDRNAHSWAAYMRRGNWQFEFAFTNMEWMRGAIADFERAVERYPSDVEVLIQAALAYFVVGDYEAAERLLGRAESVDKVNTHVEQRILTGKVYWPESFAGQIRSHQSIATDNREGQIWQNNTKLWSLGRTTIGSRPGNLKAEPLVKAMRTLLDARKTTPLPSEP